MNFTIPQLLEYVSAQHGLRRVDLAAIMGITGSSLQGVLKNKKDLSFLAANRLMNYLGLALDEFTAMLSKKELDRAENTTIRYKEKMRKKSAE